MEPDRWARVEELCQAALERDERQQEAFLDAACREDPELRREVESLLEHRQRASTFLEAPAVQVAAKVLTEATGSADPARLLGRLVSHYRIVEKIASGGMGDVYLAERADGTYDKKVAVKIIQGARSSEFFVARFQNERQILANLDHPNIARLVDGGTTDQGLPYLVMEFVEGLRIDQFCSQKELPIYARLELFRTVCSAVHYAHQNLVVHRDLKPSNILVTADGVPKLLDFGIAKILDAEPGNVGSQQTLTLLRMLTPDYASPEQVRNEPISTASDVYSLGVILYELLTGRLPYHVSTDSPQEMMKAVCDTEPERPSTAALRYSEPRTELGKPSGPGPLPKHQITDRSKKLHKALAGDLDNIVLKALRKEPQRRYSSVEQFSEDIRRYLSGLPVLAHEDSRTYRARKFIGRHRFGVAAAALLVLSLAGGLAATLWQAHVAKLQRARAERRFNDVRKLANSLMFEVHDSIRDLPGGTAAKKLIIQRAQEYLDSLAQESKSDPALLRELANAYGKLGTTQGDSRASNLGDTAASLQSYRKAIELGAAAVTLDPGNVELKRQLADDYARLDLPLFQKGDRDGERECLREAQQILEPLAASSPQDPRVQYSLAKVYELNGSLFFRGNYQNQALESWAAALHIYERLAAAYPTNSLYRTDVSFGHKHLGTALLEQNHLDEALEHYREALSIDEAQLAAQPNNLNAKYFITFSYDEIGRILGKRGEFDSAISYIRKALDIRAAQAAADPGDTRARAGLAVTYNYMGQVLLQKPDYSGALTSFRQALSIQEALARSDPSNQRLGLGIAETKSWLGQAYVAMSGQPHLTPEKRLEYCRESAPWFESALPAYLQQQSEGKLKAEDLNHLAEAQKAQRQCLEMILHEGH